MNRVNFKLVKTAFGWITRNVWLCHAEHKPYKVEFLPHDHKIDTVDNEHIQCEEPIVKPLPVNLVKLYLLKCNWLTYIRSCIFQIFQKDPFVNYNGEWNEGV